MIWFKYEIVQKRKNTRTFTFGLNAAENTHYHKKDSDKNFSASNFGQKVREGICVSLLSVELVGSKDDMV